MLFDLSGNERDDGSDEEVDREQKRVEFIGAIALQRIGKDHLIGAQKIGEADHEDAQRRLHFHAWRRVCRTPSRRVRGNHGEVDNVRLA